MEMNFLGFDISLTWLLVSALIIIYICNDLWIRSYWKRHGIKSPPSIPIFGNTLQWIKGIQKAFLEYNQKLGNVYGVCDFHRPALAISDVDMLKEIMVKSFSSFANRWVVPLMSQDLSDALFLTKDDHWKGIRNVVTPTFSAAKMKQMSPLVNECASTLMKHLKKGQELHGFIEFKELIGAYAMDSIASCAFGLKIDSQENRYDPFVTHAKTAFEANAFASPLVLFSTLFPWTVPLLKYFDFNIINKTSTQFFSEIVKRTIVTRQESASSRKKIDYLQLLINSYEGKASNHTNDTTEDDGNPSDEAFAQRGLVNKTARKSTLNESEVISQALVFFLAGYETTGTAAGFMLYLLATHPDVQDRLVEEIDDVASSVEDVGYQSISKMSYLDQVFSETLRIYPSAPIIDRVANETFVVNGFTVPKGMRIFIPLFSIHRDPILWPDPEVFDPDRFSKENREKHHPCAWMPFGLGPRSCVGMRFAVMEIKIVVIRILQKYRIETCPQTQIPPKLGTGATIAPPSGFSLRIVERN
ncbi:cytochrome P450 3A14-like [Lytechinus variegatus]|uniref:cytochrome P450 3A14-like n=1 Tax=Lytechinus variegatus TaxID=7654 RepID=UPI001BB22322|nr:cytochrome P450 3A14-like [Lytechinus variegatus]